MHYYTIVVTKEFPTDEVLGAVLAPWAQIGDGYYQRPSSGQVKFDYWRRACPSESRSNIDPATVTIPYALVIDGTWHEPASGWKPDGSEWERKLKEAVAGVPYEHWLSIVDCHC
jgi:hypothetical protein